MRRQLKSLLPSLAVIFAAGTAVAAEAVAKVGLNVRSGPGTSYRVVDVLRRGERVTTAECTSSGWCYIEQDGPDGWVSARYLGSPPQPGSTGNCSFTLTIGSGTPRFQLKCPEPVRPRPEPWRPAPPPSARPEACFYTGYNYTGISFCTTGGTYPRLGSGVDNRISSVRIDPELEARLCTGRDMTGTCVRVVGSTRRIKGRVDDRVSSIAVERKEFPPVGDPFSNGGPPVRPRLVEPGRGEACFYKGPNYTGEAFCMEKGTMNMLYNGFNDAISSLRVGPGAAVMLCQHPSFTGACIEYDRDAARLDRKIDEQASSVEVWSAHRSRREPVRVTLTGKAVLPLGRGFDLETGDLARANADLVYGHRRGKGPVIEPAPGAQITRVALGRLSLKDCRKRRFGNSFIARGGLRPGNSFCVQTREGNLGVVKILSVSDTALKIRFKLARGNKRGPLAGR